MIRRMLQPENRQALFVIFLLALSFTVYLNTYRHQFAYDDQTILLSDHRLRSVSSLPSLFTHDYWMQSNTNIYRPMTMLTLAVNYFLSGESPWSYHVVNQLLHCLNVVLLFLFLGNFYRQETAFRFLASAIFAVHPAATEAVNLIVGRAELLSFAFSISAFHLYLRRANGSRFLIGSFLLFFLGMLSKESAMMLPVFLALHHLYFERYGSRALFLRDMAGFGAVLLLYAALRYAVLGYFGPQELLQIFHGVPRTTIAFTMTKVLASYWKIAFWPVNLQVHYTFDDIPLAASLFDSRVLLSGSLLALVIAAALWMLKRNRTLSFFLLWPFIAFFPVMNVIVPTGVLMAIRLMYLPLAGYSVLLASLLSRAWPLIDRVWQAERKRSQTFWGLVGACLALYAVSTMDRNADWKDADTLFRKELSRSSQNIAAIQNLALSMPAAEAEAMLKRAIALSPADPRSYRILGIVYERQGDRDAAEAMFRRSLMVEQNEEAHWALGILLSNSGRLDEAEEQFRKAILLKPYKADAYQDLAVLLYKKGDWDGAFEASRQAVRLNPSSGHAYNLVGKYYMYAGRYDKAIEAFRKSVEFSPRLYEARYNLADAYEKVDPAMALGAWKEYIRTAEGVDAELSWVAEARRRIEALLKVPQER